jgi:hypothetical protein
MCTYMKNGVSSNPIDFWGKRINSRYANPCRWIRIVHLWDETMQFRRSAVCDNGFNIIYVLWPLFTFRFITPPTHPHLFTLSEKCMQG